LARRTLRVRLLAFAVGSVLFVVVLELASFILFYAAAGRRFSYEAIAREQAFEITSWTPPPPRASPPPAQTMAAPPPTTKTPADPGRPERTPVGLVPHPFMGFVYDPEDPRLLAAQGRGALPLTEHGFFDLPAPPGAGEELSVAVFGGSVAAYFWFEAREALTRVLQADPRLRNRRVYVRSFALGGFKQPQMLGALTYLMALGERFDVVVELDGFNDVALTYFASRHKDMFPAYPRDWDGLVAQAADLERQRTIGKVAFLQEWRARVARPFARRPFSWSVTAGLVWKTFDRFFGGQLARAREELMISAGGTRYRERGPVRRYGSDEERLADIARLWGRSSLQMSRLCAGAGTRYYHFLQPNQYVPGSKPMSEAEKAVAFMDNHPYRSAIGVGYPLLRAEGARLRELGVDFHDLSALYADVAEPLYIDECCHVNARGNALMGEAVGKAIVAGWDR
jgi:hypothetical protein